MYLWGVASQLMDKTKKVLLCSMCLSIQDELVFYKQCTVCHRHVNVRLNIDTVIRVIRKRGKLKKFYYE